MPGYKVADIFADFSVNIDKGMGDAVRAIRANKSRLALAGMDAGDAFGKGFGTAATKHVDTTAKDVAKHAPKFRAAGEKMGGELGEGFDSRASRDTERATEKVAKRTEAKFSALKFAGAFAGLPAAAALAGAGVVGGLAVAAGGFAALGVAFNNESADVKSSVSSLTQHVTGRMTAMASQMTEPTLGALESVGAAFDRMEPQINAAMAASAPAVHELVGAVTDLAENAMPGVLTAVQHSGPALAGFRELAGDVGGGISDMLTNMSSASQAAGDDMGVLGGTIRDLLGFVGSLFANLATGATGPLTIFRGALSQVESLLLEITSSGMPAITGAFGGFMAPISGALGLATAFASALGSWTAPLGTAAGAVYGVNSITKLFGTSLGSVGFGLGAFTTQVDSAGNKVNPFKTALADADKAGTSKFKAGLGAVVSGGLNPVGVALTVAGVALSLFGASQEETAQRVAAHKDAVNDLTAALQRDSGALGAATQSTVTKALTDKDAYKNAGIFGVAMQDVTKAGMGNKDAMDAVTGSAKGYITQILSSTGATQDNINSAMGMVDAYAKQGSAAGDSIGPVQQAQAGLGGLSDAQRKQVEAALATVGAIGEQNGAMTDAQKKYADMEAAASKAASVIAQTMTPAMYAAQVSVGNLSGAFDQLNKTGGDFAAKGQAIIDIINEINGVHMSAEEALQAFNDHLRGMADAMKEIKKEKFSATMIDAAGKIDTASKAGSDLQNVIQQGAKDMGAYGQSLKDAGVPADQIRGKLGAMRDQMEAQLKVLGLTPAQIDNVMNHYGAIPDQIITTLGLEGDKETQGKIKDIVAKLAGVPAWKPINVGVLDAPAVKALQELGYQVRQLPDGTFEVAANTDPAVVGIEGMIQWADGAHATPTVGANTQPAFEALNNWKTTTDNTHGLSTQDANNGPAIGESLDWLSFTNGIWGTSTQGANSGPANSSVWSWINFANSASGTGDLLANIDPAVAAWNSWDPASKYGSVYAKLSIVPADYATGGMVGHVPGFASGGQPGHVPHAATGMFHGRGTGTSDSNLVAISDGEFIEPASTTRANRDLLEYIRMGNEVAWTPVDGGRGSAGASTAHAPSAPVSGAGGSAMPPITINGYMASPGELVEKMNQELAWQMRA